MTHFTALNYLRSTPIKTIKIKKSQTSLRTVYQLDSINYNKRNATENAIQTLERRPIKPNAANIVVWKSHTHNINTHTHNTTVSDTHTRTPTNKHNDHARSSIQKVLQQKQQYLKKIRFGNYTTKTTTTSSTTGS